MSHTKGSTCSECGKTQKHEKLFFKTRRRWRWSFVAVLLMIAGSIGTQWPKVQNDGWFAIVPNYVLIFALPVAGDYQGDWWVEVLRRYYADEYSENEFYYLIKKCANGDIFTRPTSLRWQLTYGRLLTQHNTMIMQRLRNFPEAVYDLQYQIPARVDIEIHDPWPRDLPMRFQVYSDDWWPHYAGFRATVTPRVEGTESTVSPTGFTVEAVVPTPDENRATIVFDVMIERRHHSWLENPKDSPVWEEVERRVIKKKVNIVETADFIFTPVNSDDVNDEVMRISLNSTFRDGKFFNGYINHLPTNTKVCSDTAFGITVELMQNDKVIAYKNYWWRGGGRPYSNDLMALSPWVKLTEESFDSAVIKTFTARVRSDKELAIRVPGVDKYWEGEVSIPINTDEQ